MGASFVRSRPDTRRGGPETEEWKGPDGGLGSRRPARGRDPRRSLQPGRGPLVSGGTPVVTVGLREKENTVQIGPGDDSAPWRRGFRGQGRRERHGHLLSSLVGYHLGRG